MNIFLKKFATAILIMVVFAMATLACSSNAPLNCTDGFFQKSVFSALEKINDPLAIRTSLNDIVGRCKIEGKNKELFLEAVDKYITYANNNDLVSLYKEFEKNVDPKIRLELFSRSSALKVASGNNILSGEAKIDIFDNIGKSIKDAGLSEQETINVGLLSDSETDVGRVVAIVNGSSKYLVQLHGIDGGSGGSTTLSLDNITVSSYARTVSGRPSENIVRPAGSMIEFFAYGTAGRMLSKVVIDSQDRLLGFIGRSEQLSSDSRRLCKSGEIVFSSAEQIGIKTRFREEIPCQGSEDFPESNFNDFLKKLQATPILRPIAHLVNYQRFDIADKALVQDLKMRGREGRAQLIDDLFARYLDSAVINDVADIVKMSTKVDQLMIGVDALYLGVKSTNSGYIYNIKSGLTSLVAELKQIPDVDLMNQALDGTKGYSDRLLFVVRQLDGPATYDDRTYDFVYEALAVGRELVLVVADQPAFTQQGYTTIHGKKIATDTVKLKPELGGFLKDVDVFLAASPKDLELLRARAKFDRQVNDLKGKASRLDGLIKNYLPEIRDDYIGHR